MKIFVDTANLDDIREALDWGILDGVTTNPSHIAAEGRKFRELVEEICTLVPGPVSVEATALEAKGMLAQAREIVKIADNIVIKIPSIVEGVKAVKLCAHEGIKTNFTLVFSAAQALLAAKAGATYVSPFVGRLDSVGDEGMELVSNIRTIYDNYGYQTQIIVAAVRHPGHVLQAALIGADVTTMRMHVMRQLITHSLTDVGLKAFMADWEKVPK